MERDLSRLVEEAVSVLRKGGIVAFPTETVYGLGADPEREAAVTRVFSIKGRAREKPLTLMLATPAEVKGYARRLPKSADKLIATFWPGPLVLVLKASASVPRYLLGPNSTVGIRATRNPAARMLLEGFGSALATTSANMSGRDPFRSGSEVAAELGGKVDFVLPGVSGFSRPSTVLDISRFPPSIERSGAISPLLVARTMRRKVALSKNVFFRILLVCTGNACRSPMAEGLLKKMLPEGMKKKVIVSSAGTDPIQGSPPTPNAVQAARELGADIRGLSSREVAPSMIENADLILTMELAHRDRVADIVPEAWEKTHLLKGYGQAGVPAYEREIRDPIGMPLEFYRGIALEIRSSLKGVVSELSRWLAADF